MTRTKIIVTTPQNVILKFVRTQTVPEIKQLENTQYIDEKRKKEMKA